LLDHRQAGDVDEKQSQRDEEHGACEYFDDACTACASFVSACGEHVSVLCCLVQLCLYELNESIRGELGIKEMWIL
jgi:hypothetical protein